MLVDKGMYRVGPVDDDAVSDLRLRFRAEEFPRDLLN
jgi:hypothetical protein